MSEEALLHARSDGKLGGGGYHLHRLCLCPLLHVSQGQALWQCRRGLLLRQTQL